MGRACALVCAIVSLTAGAPGALAQDLSRYRMYALESDMASVLSASGARETDATTLHERPAKIQELQWRASYLGDASAADPVREIVFKFVNDSLYQVVVTYDRGRTEGLTADEIVRSLSAIYGAPMTKSLRAATGRPPLTSGETVLLAQWQSNAASLSLVRATYYSEFQLIFVSKPLNARATSAIREAVRLDALDAPRRARERREKDAADEQAARDKARTANQDAFRP